MSENIQYVFPVRFTCETSAGRVEIIAGQNAPNYVGMTLYSKRTYQKYELIMRREKGETPAEQNTRLKERIVELETELAALKRRKRPAKKEETKMT